MLENISLDTAAELLAKRRMASQAIGGFAKFAAGWRETLLGKTPAEGALRNALIGAGLGAGGGALLGALHADEDEDTGEAARRGAMRGLISGGALGAGGTLLGHTLPNPQTANAPPPKVEPGAFGLYSPLARATGAEQALAGGVAGAGIQLAARPAVSAATTHLGRAGRIRSLPTEQIIKELDTAPGAIPLESRRLATSINSATWRERLMDRLRGRPAALSPAQARALDTAARRAASQGMFSKIPGVRALRRVPWLGFALGATEEYLRHQANAEAAARAAAQNAGAPQ
jgi:hypothetical protein